MKMLKATTRALILAFLLTLPAAHSQEVQEVRENTDYVLVQPPQPPRIAAGKIEVIEFFNFSCPHCFRLQPHFERWQAQTDMKDIVIVRQPVVFQRFRGHFARVYYTLAALGIEEEYAEKVYDAIHGQRKLLNSEGRFLDWLEEEGVDRNKAEKVYNSFSISTRTTRAENIIAEYGVDSTPQFVVAGKYRTNASLTGSNKKLMEVLTALIERERKR